MPNFIIDAHVHLVTMEMLEDRKKNISGFSPEFKKKIITNYQNFIDENFIKYLSESSLKNIADDWIREMDKNGIQHAMFFPISENLEQCRDFVKFAPDRFSAYAFLNGPGEQNAPEKLRKAVKEYGFKGLKIYPSVHMVHASDKALFPLYEEAQTLGIPITFHFGITHSPVCDYRYTNPLDIQMALKLFPKLNFIIAHFGAGFFREVCLLAFHSKNLYLDTSGTNNWRFYTPENMPLKEIFKRAIDIYSPEKIIFGTDTVLGRDKEYRAQIKNEQIEILNSLDITKDHCQKIMAENAQQLYGITR